MSCPKLALCAAVVMTICSPVAGAQDVKAIPATSVVGAALAMVPDVRERARFVAMAENSSRDYRMGFSTDGYAVEGVGAYLLAAGDEQPTGDAGSPVYDATTFTSKRRTIKLINSYGHPVPLVAGQLQIDGGKATPRVVSKTLTDAKDTMVIDLRPAYDVPTLTTLTRTMTRKRGKAESIATRDDFTFARPESFETALVTGGEAKVVDAGTIEFQRGKRRVRASVKASSAFSLTPETIIAAGVTFTRIAVQLRDKHKRGHVTDTFTNSR